MPYSNCTNFLPKPQKDSDRLFLQPIVPFFGYLVRGKNHYKNTPTFSSNPKILFFSFFVLYNLIFFSKYEKKKIDLTFEFRSKMSCLFFSANYVLHTSGNHFYRGAKGSQADRLSDVFRRIFHYFTFDINKVLNEKIVKKVMVGFLP